MIAFWFVDAAFTAMTVLLDDPCACQLFLRPWKACLIRFRSRSPAGDWQRKEVAFLVKIVKRNNESTQQMIRRFRKAVSQSGKLSALRKKRWFISESEERRIAKKKAIRRQNRRTAQSARKRRRYY